MLLCWTLRKLSNIFTLETARYNREQDDFVFGDKFSSKFKLMFVRLRKPLQVAGTSLQSFAFVFVLVFVFVFVIGAAPMKPLYFHLA